jgi:protein subunit release factor A
MKAMQMLRNKLYDEKRLRAEDEAVVGPSQEARCPAATAAPRSAPTTTPKAASPITASTSPCTTCAEVMDGAPAEPLIDALQLADRTEKLRASSAV